MLQLLDELAFHKNPWREFDRIQRDLGRAAQTMLHTGERRRAPLNIYRNEDQLKIQVRRPGWRAEWFELSVEGSKLFVKGAPQDQDGNPLENGSKLNRTVNLPFRAQADQVEAKYAQGVLTISLTKAAEDKPKTITVQSA